MAELQLILRYDPETNLRELLIHYESEADLLPFEHEEDHRAVIERLLGRPLEELADQLRFERIAKESYREQARAVEATSERALPVAESAIVPGVCPMSPSVWTDANGSRATTSMANVPANGLVAAVVSSIVTWNRFRSVSPKCGMPPIDVVAASPQATRTVPPSSS